MFGIARYQHYCILLLITVLCIYTGIESVNNNQAFDSNNEKEDEVELGDILL